MSKDFRLQAVDAVDLLNDFVGDCVAGVMVLRSYQAGLKRHQNGGTALVAIHKMCISYIVLTLFKWLEFHEKYKSVIPDQHKKACKNLYKLLEQKGIRPFRHKCIGHIWDDDLKRPLFNSEIMTRLDNIIDNDLDKFLNWINDPTGNVYPNTVVSIVETLRDSLVQEHKIHENEIIKR
ncbi:MAG: hypothetical protein WA435_08135 [Gallionellaceae bacterium]